MMKDIRCYFKNKSSNELFFEASLYFYVGTLPLFLNLNTIALWFLIASSLFTIKAHKGLSNLKENLVNLLPICLLYLMFIIGLFLSKNKQIVYVDLTRTLPLCIIPFIVFLNGKKHFNIKKIFIALGIGIGIGILICWQNIFLSIMSKAEPLKQAGYFFEWIYTDINLVKPLKGHPSYFAILIVIFISAIIFDKNFETFRENKLRLLLLLTPYFIFLIETNSRVGIIVLLVLFFVYTIKHMSLKLLLSFFFLVSVITLFSIKFDYLGSKFQKVINSKGEVTSERVGRWREIIEVFKEKDSHIFGVGSGDARLVYRRAYYNGKYNLAFKKNYNAHNQYLELLVSNGVLGLSVYLFVFLFFSIQTKLKANALHFFIAFSIFSFSETLFGRSQGVMMFSFFYALFIVNNKTLMVTKDGNEQE